jgi:hypothetical protein
MTLATEIFYTGLHPYTLQPVYTAKTKEEKQGQLKYFFFYKIEYRAAIINSLKKMGRSDMITKLFH